MKRYLWLAGVLLALAADTGCVERRFLVTSEVPGVQGDAGAMVYVNGQQIGPTPVDYYYTYYGKYHLTLVKDGSETLQVDQPVPAPWYEFFLLDFFSENVYPFKVRDVRVFPFALQPPAVFQPNDVLRRGTELREKGKTIEPLPDALPPPPKPGTPPVPPPG